MSEQLDLATPETFPTPPSITYWRVNGLFLTKDPARVTIILRGTNSEERTFTFTGTNATAYINALNKRNATVTSNEKWTLNQLVSKGNLAGTVSGTPD